MRTAHPAPQQPSGMPFGKYVPFLREQAVSVTAHRFGTPLDLAEGLL